MFLSSFSRAVKAGFIKSDHLKKWIIFFFEVLLFQMLTKIPVFIKLNPFMKSLSLKIILETFNNKWIL